VKMGKHSAGSQKVRVFLIGHFRRVPVVDGMKFSLTPGKLGEIMDERINRFKLCDLHFHPYFARVIERLPEEVREDVLNDKSFQILTDDDALNACVLTNWDFLNRIMAKFPIRYQTEKAWRLEF